MCFILLYFRRGMSTELSPSSITDIFSHNAHHEDRSRYALVSENLSTSKWDSIYGMHGAVVYTSVNHVMHCLAGHLQLVPLHVRLRSYSAPPHVFMRPRLSTHVTG